MHFSSKHITAQHMADVMRLHVEKQEFWVIAGGRRPPCTSISMYNHVSEFLQEQYHHFNMQPLTFVAEFCRPS